MRDVLISQKGEAGCITLNRPVALNALSEQMIGTIAAALEAWRDDAAISRIVVDAVGDKAFCAGGDVRGLYHAAMAGDHDAARFFRKEYHLNAALAEYPKPVISFMHDIVMGGGVGLGCHVAHRVIAPDAVLAMPETRIGLVPDIGGTHLLAQMPGGLGLYFGLTSARMTGLQAVAGGFADHAIPMTQWDALKQDIYHCADPAMLRDVSEPAAEALDSLRDQMDPIFQNKTVREIWAACDGITLGATLSGLSPLSIIVTWHLITHAAQAPGLRAALEREFRVTSRAVEHTDLLEGVRAALVDKDQTPKWRYRTIQDVPGDAVEALLAPVAKGLFT